MYIYIYMCLSVSLSLSVCRAHARTVGPRTQYQHTCIGGLWEHAADFPNSKHQEAFAIKTYGGCLFFIFYCGSFFFGCQAQHATVSKVLSGVLIYYIVKHSLELLYMVNVPGH